MAAYQIFNIIFSLILLPVNVFCAFWLFREALNLTGMTFQEFLDTTASRRPFSGIGRHRLRKKHRFFVKFFRQYSSDPKRSIQLLWTFGICTLPGLAALNIAFFAAIHIDKLKYALMGNFILLFINLLALWGKAYKKNHALDDVPCAKPKKEKECGEKKNVKNIVIYSLVGLFFFGILLFFMLGISGLTQSQTNQYPQKSAVTIHAELITILNEKGYETANVPTTYWEIDETKLLHVAAGKKGGTKFEFYGYSDDETVDLVYNQMVYLTAPEVENARRESYETSLPGGGKMFTIKKDGMQYLILYKNDTAIFAYSKSSLNEIKEILRAIGYLKNKS